VLAVKGAGEQGLTVHELAGKLRLNQCATSALLSRLAADGRLTYRRPAKRGQTGRYWELWE
jgi:predicted ArsR family transcriptional regulator